MDLRLSPPPGRGDNRSKPKKAELGEVDTQDMSHSQTPVHSLGKCSSTDFRPYVVLLICFCFRSRGGRLSVVARILNQHR